MKTDTEPLVWIENSGSGAEPIIFDGWEFAGVRLFSGKEITSGVGDVREWEWGSGQIYDKITHFAVRRKPGYVLLRTGIMKINGLITTVGATFVEIKSGDRYITLSLSPEEAKWLAHRNGAEIKLHVEVQL